MPALFAGLRRLLADTRRHSLMHYSSLALLVAVAAVAVVAQLGSSPAP